MIYLIGTDTLIYLIKNRPDSVAARVRSPLVTAVATTAMARTWLVRLAANWIGLQIAY